MRVPSVKYAPPPGTTRCVARLTLTLARARPRGSLAHVRIDGGGGGRAFCAGRVLEVVLVQDLESRLPDSLGLLLLLLSFLSFVWIIL